MSDASSYPAKLDEAALLEYFDAVHHAFLGAEGGAPHVWERSFRLAGVTLLVRTPSPSLVSPMTMALAHLAVDYPPPPDLTIHLWDSASTGKPAPPSPLAWHADRHGSDRMTGFHAARFDARGEPAAFNSRRIRTSFHVSPNVLRVLDTRRNLGFYWIDDAAQVPYYETAAPLRKFLSWWFSERDCLFVHGAAVGFDTGGVLLVGDAGSGKSTAALACLDAGMRYAGDDYCVVTSRPHPFVHALYNTAKLKGPDDLRRFPNLEPLVSNYGRLDREKALLFLHPRFPGLLAGGFPLCALLTPKVTGASPARIRPISPEAALRAVSPSTVRQLPGSGRTAFREMAHLVRTLPGYVLEVGPAAETIPVAIRRFLAERMQ
ncbi:MAG: hypothetical protein KIT09_34415 [Bryobacteraceae bacterium]|nr:hypothetical protein [Bryobacteraceae bacterium]